MAIKRFLKKCEYCGRLFAEDEKHICHKRPGMMLKKETVDERCECGNLLARTSLSVIEIKCRKCKRIIEIPGGSVAERYEDKLNQ